MPDTATINKTFEKKLSRVGRIAETLALTPKERRRYFSRVGRMVVAQTKLNQRDQKTVSRIRMKNRSPETCRKKGTQMFKKMVKGRFLRVTSNPMEAMVHFAGAGAVARKHHDGYAENVEHYDYPHEFDFSEIPARLFNREGVAGCTARMAAQMIRFGVVPPEALPLRGSVAQQLLRIMATVSRGRAVARIIAGKQTMPSMNILRTVPARPILGATQKQVLIWKRELLNTLHGKFRAKNYAESLT